MGGTDSGKGIPTIEVQAKTDRTTATIADPIVFTISALYAPGIKVQIPEIGSQLAGLRITDFGEEGPVEIDTRSPILPPTLAWTRRLDNVP